MGFLNEWILIPFDDLSTQILLFQFSSFRVIAYIRCIDHFPAF